MTRVGAVLAAIVSLLGVAVHGGERTLPWQAPAYARRAIVHVSTRDPFGQRVDPSVHCAVVRLFTSGLVQPSADDVRIFDKDGHRLPYEITYLDARRQLLIAFRVPKPGTDVCVYFGNAHATRDELRIDRPRLGFPNPPSAPPADDGWTPHAGLILTTYDRPRRFADPTSMREMLQLIRASAGPQGADDHRHISDAINRYGRSDRYISIYRGWINIPRDGLYHFCTASDDASFVFLDGHHLVDWPGSHSVYQGGAHGEHNAARYLKAGPHYVVYLHENGQAAAVAFLGWKPPGQDRYGAIADSIYRQPYQAVVTNYQAAPGRWVPTIQPHLLDTIWPADRDHAQYARVGFTLGPQEPSPDRWRYTWHFGDGQTATGNNPQHVYLHTGTFHLTLDAVSPSGRRMRLTFPLRVFRVTIRGYGFSQGAIGHYAKLLAGENIPSFDLKSLQAYAQLESDLNHPGLAAAAARDAMKHPHLTNEQKQAMHLLAAEGLGTPARAWRNGDDTIAMKAAVVQLLAARRLAGDPATRLAIDGRLIRVLGVALGDPQAAAGYFEDAKKRAAGKPDGQTREAWRDVLIAWGDTALAAGQTTDAAKRYREAQTVDEDVDPALRAARLGACAMALRQALDEHRLKDARTWAARWYHRFPASQIDGQLLFLIGKLSLVRGHPHRALRPLALSIALGQGSDFEAEARWFSAKAFGQVKAPRQRIAALKALIDSGITGPYREKAEKAIAAASATGTK